MISISTNIDSVIESLKQKVAAVAQTDELLRTITTNMRAAVKTRIHEEGKDANGGQIGTYSNAYLVLRSGSFKNNLKTKGKNKGKAQEKTAGVYTKGRNKGKPRFNYPKHVTDPMVTISLTKAMEN